MDRPRPPAGRLYGKPVVESLLEMTGQPFGPIDYEILVEDTLPLEDLHYEWVKFVVEFLESIIYF